MIKVAAYNNELEKIAKEFAGMSRVDAKKREVFNQIDGIDNESHRSINKSTLVGLGIGSAVGSLMSAGGMAKSIARRNIGAKSKALALFGSAVGGTTLVGGFLGAGIGNSSAKERELARAGFRVDRGRIYASDETMKKYNLTAKQ